MKFRTLILAGIAITVLAVMLIPYVLPLDRCIPEIERLASEQLRTQVKVGALRLAMLPRPHLTVFGIVVGKKPFLQVNEVVLTPRLRSLFSSPKIISSISLRDVVIGRALIAKASAWASRAGGSTPAAVRVERVEVRNAFVNMTEVQLRDVSVDLEMTSDGGLAHARLRAENGHLDASLVPSGRVYAVNIAAHDWRLPAGPPLLLSSLSASGTLDPRQGLSLASVEGRLYEGAASGELNIGWTRQWTIAGRLAIRDVAIQPVVALFTKDTTISGRLSANPVVDMRSPSAAQLGEAVDIESDFKVEQGVLYNMDLGNAPKVLFNKDALKGGQTRFDNFTGHLGVDATGYYLTNVEISSGVLGAEAQLWISPKRELIGQIDVALKGTSALVSTPLSVGGTVQNPTLYPSKASLAGAAAGTMLLGPGIGTTVGMKAARFTQKLFGPKQPKKTRQADSETRNRSVEPAAVGQGNPAPAVHTGR